MNNIIDVEGIIISSRDYNDTSKILDIFTKEYGIIGVLAKGCKSLKSNLRSVTSNMTYATFTIYYKKDKLSILKEATVIDNFKNIQKDIVKISYASFLLDISKQVYKQCNDVIVIYTGYNKKEDFLVENMIRKYHNIIIKWGRYIVGHKPHYDEALGIMLASDNQYAEVIE